MCCKWSRTLDWCGRKSPGTVSQRGTCHGSSALVRTSDDKFRSTTESTHDPNLPLTLPSVVALLRSHDATTKQQTKRYYSFYALWTLLLYLFYSFRCCKVWWEQPVRYVFTRSRIFTLKALFVSVAMVFFCCCCTQATMATIVCMKARYLHEGSWTVCGLSLLFPPACGH